MEHFSLALLDWSRAQFALTAMYHWLFVPLTLGTSFIIAIMETIYVKTGDEHWKKITKFWMTLFAINFAIGVATGIILEFEFGTNWSNYSWFVGDIFGAPLAVEGIMAFFMEATFFAVMFFGWKKVSKGFHLTSTWMVAIGSNISALWILVANSWMQNPVGMHFNPVTARNEMVNFWAVLFSPTAINKFLHTVSSAYVLSAIFVLGVSAWFLLKNRNLKLAKRSAVVASTFGLISILFTILTGDGSAREAYRVQPMKFDSFEGLYYGAKAAPLITFGIFDTHKPTMENQNPKVFTNKFEVPKLLSLMATLNPNSYIPGINDYIKGNKAMGIISYSERIKMGQTALAALKTYQEARQTKNDSLASTSLKTFQDNYKYMGYGYFKDPYNLIPNVPLAFYSFHLMVGLGMLFVILFILGLIYSTKDNLHTKRWFLYAALWTIPLAWLASEAGWLVNEMGRQPWVIQNLMPTRAALSNISSTSVMITFFLFGVTFTILMIAEIRIMLKQIKQLNDGGH